MSLVCWFDVYPIPWSKYRGGQMKIYDHLMDRIIITICIWGEWECPLIPPPPHRGRCPILAYHSKGFSFNSVSKYYKATSWAEFRKFSRGWGGRGIRFGWDCLFFGNVNLIAWIFLGGGDLHCRSWSAPGLRWPCSHAWYFGRHIAYHTKYITYTLHSVCLLDAHARIY